MSDRKLSLPTPSCVPRTREDLNKTDDALVSPDKLYNKIARSKGLVDWLVETFRRMSLRSDADSPHI